MFPTLVDKLINLTKTEPKQNHCLAPDQKMVRPKKCANDQKVNLAPLIFLTAILHRGLRNDFFFSVVRHFRKYFFHILYGLLFPFSIWTFISLL